MSNSQGCGCGSMIGILIMVAVGGGALWLLLLGLIWAMPWLILFAVASTLLVLALGALVCLIKMVGSLARGSTELASVTDLPHPPAGPAQHFGWDRARLAYFPYQARKDTHKLVHDLLATALWPIGLSSARGWLIPCAVAAIPLGIGWTVGGLIVLGICVATVMVLGVLTWALRTGLATLHAAFDRLRSRIRRVSTFCPSCYQPLSNLGFACPGCATIHYDLSAPAFGILYRHCECGERLPTAQLVAADRLAAVCPVCITHLPSRAGAHPTMLLATFGASAAGKTTLLARLLLDAETSLRAAGGHLSGAAPAALSFLAEARSEISQMPSTVPDDHPPGYPYSLSMERARAEMQILDAAGDFFCDWHSSDELRYLDTAPALIFVLDPFSLPLVRNRGPVHAGAASAHPDTVTAYTALVDRLRATAISLSKRSLAIVVTRREQIRHLTPEGPDRFRDSAGIRAWLEENKFDGFIRRVEEDFSRVGYFATDPIAPATNGDLHTLPLLHWLATAQHLPKQILRAFEPPARLAKSQ